MTKEDIIKIIADKLKQELIKNPTVMIDIKRKLELAPETIAMDLENNVNASTEQKELMHKFNDKYGNFAVTMSLNLIFNGIMKNKW